MSKNNTILTVVAAAALGIGGYALYKNLGGIGKGIKETAETVTETATTIYDNPVSKKSREVLDELGIIDKDNPIKTYLSGSMATNPLEKFGNLFGSLFSRAANTGIKAAADPVDTAKKNISSFVGATPGNPFYTISNFIGSFFDREGTTMATYDSSDYSVDVNGKQLSSIQKTAAAMSGINPESVEIIGAPSTLTKEEKEKLPTKTINELASQKNFLGRVFKSVKDKFNL